MATSAPPPPYTGRDPAVAIWAAAGTCWALTAALALAGLGACHDGAAVDRTAGAPGPAPILPGWLVMVGAMMLPTVVPLARMVAVVTTRAARARAVLLALLAGYLAVWSVFAAAATLGADALLDDDAHPARSGLVLGGVLVVAGLFQFSALKHVCLTACRSPWAFLWRYYGRGIRAGWLLGVRHGVFCLGCCWALMLVMTAAGIASLLWMLALTGVMVAERTAPWGARLVRPLGVALVLAGIAVAALVVRDPTRAGDPGAGGEAALLVAGVALAAAGWAGAVARRRRQGRHPAGLTAKNADDRPQPSGTPACPAGSGR